METTKSKTSFRSAIVKMLDDSTMTDPREIADRIIQEVDPEEHEEMLRQALPLLVREAIKEHRDRRAPKPSVRQPGVSRKIIAARSIFSARYCGADGMKMLSSFTADDIKFVIIQNKAQAEAVLEKNKRWTMLLEELTSSSKTQVGELDEETVVQILQD